MKKYALLFIIAVSILLTGDITKSVAEDAALNELLWPKELTTSGGKITIYQPQVQSLEGDRLQGMAAFSFASDTLSKEIFGAIWFEAEADVDRDYRTVEITHTKVRRVRLADATDKEQKRIGDTVKDEAEGLQFTISYDHLLASMNSSAEERRSVQDLNTAPPDIIFKIVPAILVTFAGEPELRSINNTDLLKAINTPFYIVFDKAVKLYYLSGGIRWFSATKIKEDWKVDQNVPGEVINAYDAEQERIGAVPDKSGQVKDNRIPVIVVATKPSELIVADGQPMFSPLPGGELLYMSNSESDVFIEVASQNYYIVLSGRWFRSKSMGGPWEFVRSDMLPSAFVKIPENSAKGNVLPFVAGTQDAKEAVIDAQIPQTAAIDRKKATLKVIYDGDPEFRPIPKTSIEYAINSQQTVLGIDGGYYCCEHAVWYKSNSPFGPWEAADKVPAQVQDIPPESPCYNIKYVYIYDSTPDVVYVGYTPGYLWCYPYYGSIVYGTGFYYSPWIGPRHFFPHPVTWGFQVNYNPWTGWSYGMSWSSGWVTFGIGFGFVPGWWGPAGFCWRPNRNFHTTRVIVNRPVFIRDRDRGRFEGRFERRNNLYHEGRDRAFVRSRRNLTGPQRFRRQGAVPQGRREGFHGRPPGTQGRERNLNRFAPAGNRSNNIFTDMNGHIYQRESNGSWRRREQGRWRPDGPQREARPNVDRGNLNRENEARIRGMQRSRSFHRESGGKGQSPKGGHSESGGSGGTGGRHR